MHAHTRMIAHVLLAYVSGAEAIHIPDLDVSDDTTLDAHTRAMHAHTQRPCVCITIAAHVMACPRVSSCADVGPSGDPHTCEGGGGEAGAGRRVPAPSRQALPQ